MYVYSWSNGCMRVTQVELVCSITPSSKATKEHLTTTYMYMICCQLPNRGTECSMKCLNDDTEMHVFRDSKVRGYKLAAAMVVQPITCKRFQS